MPSLADNLKDLTAVAQAAAAFSPALDKLAVDLVAVLKAGGKVLTAGNGGSACDAQHFSEELVGRYRSNRRSLPAICLSADGALLTCIANDFGFDQVFARQVESLCEPRDLLIVFSSSGGSPNIQKALQTARAKKSKTAAFLGKDGGLCKGLAQHEFIVPSQNTARIQELHTVFLHTLCDALEAAFPAGT
ncbi:MAG TPA: SIS domain-containing protein [Planctomycetota bacterium]|jgi:D-sedoheptulose 7-phosphate isomerase|nr:SIS domain-containing protein [Planctomycetota bacterium]